MINITATVGGNVMALKSDKTRILVNIPMKLKEELEKIALEDNRSVSNYVVTLIEKDIINVSPQLIIILYICLILN